MDAFELFLFGVGGVCLLAGLSILWWQPKNQDSMTLVRETPEGVKVYRFMDMGQYHYVAITKNGNAAMMDETGD